MADSSTTFPPDPNFVPGKDSDNKMEEAISGTSELARIPKRRIPNRRFTDEGRAQEKAWARLRPQFRKNGVRQR